MTESKDNAEPSGASGGYWWSILIRRQILELSESDPRKRRFLVTTDQSSGEVFHLAGIPQLGDTVDSLECYDISVTPVCERGNGWWDYEVVCNYQ